MDAGQSVIPEVHENPRVTASFFTGSRGKQRPPRSLDMRNPEATERKACVFCSEQHSPIDCTKVTTYQSRIDIFKNKQLCFNCLGSHQVSKCRSNFRCRRCQRKHYTSIRDRKSAQPTAPTVPTAQTILDQQRNQQATAILHSSTQSPSNVLLKTAIAPVRNQQFRVDATILFDERAQHSFITEKLAEDLHLPRGNPEIINLTSFGDSNQNVRFMDTSTHLQGNNNWICQILKRDLYVDNILTSLPKESDTLAYYRNARNLMLEAGFNLRSWSSNSQQMRNLAESEKVLEADDTTKVLGMLWNTVTDEMMFPAKLVPITDVITKREILKQSSRIYDSLGLLSPVTVRAKILLQELWQQKYSWDTALPKHVYEKWSALVTDLNNVMNTKVSRYYFRDPCAADDRITTTEEMSLHIFVDASTLSYGATAYLCTSNQSTFVMAKIH
ncbi:uncharacterized protein LOC123544379 [Mercenaria mercenaria]|uniref:uncharacterized protein LOC123544379 n=1 Tax=Mercenaria mercenaria TaxID=6596 RepID=UPI00234EC2E6|nr:uncharacterized protein LOC123544379 [Mercenaria mercenaria]